MSIYIQIINKIKQFYDADWLTASQRRAYEVICERLWFPSEYLNLYGVSGVGKTFLAWVLFKEQRLFYYPTINWLGRDDRERIWGVIIDNARSDKKGERETILKLQMNKVHKGVLITRNRVDDEVFAVELALNEEDKRKVISNLQTIKLGIKEETDPSYFHCLWDIIQHIGGLGRWM